MDCGPGGCARAPRRAGRRHRCISLFRGLIDGASVTLVISFRKFMQIRTYLNEWELAKAYFVSYRLFVRPNNFEFHCVGYWLDQRLLLSFNFLAWNTVCRFTVMLNTIIYIC